MKLKKAIILILILIMTISISSISYAKYVFEYTKKAVEISIDRTSPIATINSEIIEITNTNTGYENYASKKHEITIKVKIEFDDGIINKLTDFEILVGENEGCYTKETKIFESGENYIIYEIKLTNITENGQLILKIPQGSFEDSVGNKMSEKTLDTGIKIDNIPPKLEFSQENLEDGKVLAKITSNEEIRKIDGWDIDESQTLISKEFESDIKYKKMVKDFAGNSSTADIDVKNATYLGFEFIGYISDTGWVEPENNVIGIISTENAYKIESLAFRTGDKIDKDYLRMSAYITTYWGKGYNAKDPITGTIYTHGYNPTAGYKTMQNSELVTINSKQFVQVGGQGMNCYGRTDIDGNNPIPLDIATQYLYGIVSTRLALKDNTKNTIIYQLYFANQGWIETAKNGEELNLSFKNSIQGIRIAIIPTSEIKDVKQLWDQNIGKHSLE